MKERIGANSAGQVVFTFDVPLSSSCLSPFPAQALFFTVCYYTIHHNYAPILYNLASRKATRPHACSYNRVCLQQTVVLVFDCYEMQLNSYDFIFLVLLQKF